MEEETGEEGQGAMGQGVEVEEKTREEGDEYRRGLVILNGRKITRSCF